MPVPSIIHARYQLRKLVTTLLLSFVTGSVALAKNPEPLARIPLEPLGFPVLPNQFLLSGSSMYTVDFVDDKHLLVTFSTKKLLRRLADCPPADQDRILDAFLLEVPSGKVLARTSWRVHDRGQYLWNLGHGRFMLRVRDILTTFAPLVNLPHGNAFHERPFIHSDRRIGGVILSPDADLMILETLEPLPLSGDSLQPASNVSPEEQHIRLEAPVQVNFFRISHHPGEEVGVQPGGAFRARVPGRIPANAAGYVSVLDQGNRHWAFDFRSYGGKVKELSPFDSTCRPMPVLVSRGEFIAFGCHLSHTPQVVAGFNMRGEEMWEQNMTESYIAPTFAYAPRSGRFVLSRILTHSSVIQTGDLLMPEFVSGQSLIVYQTDSGRQILRIDASPVVRAGQNFALSPDGLTFAVVHNDTVELYSLPPLTDKERQAVTLAENSAPKDDGALATFGDTAPAGDSAQQPPTASTPGAPPTAAEPQPAQPATATEAPASTPVPDTQTSQPPAAESTSQPAQVARKPPTLYGPTDGPAGSQGQTDKSASPRQ